MTANLSAIEVLADLVPEVEALAGGCPLIQAGLVQAISLDLQSKRLALINKSEPAPESTALTLAEKAIAACCGNCSGRVLHSPRATTVPSWGGQFSPTVDIASS